MKIEINTENPYVFFKIASLIDREDFLQDLKSLRIKLNLEKNIPRATVVEYILKSLPKKQVAEIRLMKERFKKVFPNPVISPNNLWPMNKYDEAIQILLNKYQKSTHYFEVIRYALFSGAVEEIDYNLKGRANNYIKTNNNIYVVLPSPFDSQYFNNTINLEPYEMGLIITPEITKDDYNKAWNLINEYRKEHPKVSPRDIRPKVIKARKWYWMNKSRENGGDGMSYITIATKEYGKEQALYSEEERVRKAIKSYEKMLNIEKRKLQLK
jgi:hypothetical protein